MGMIETHIKKVPDDKTALQYATEVLDRAKEKIYEDGGDSCECEVLTLDKFEKAWGGQENLKKTDEIKEKYRQLTSEGRVIVLELDW